MAFRPIVVTAVFMLFEVVSARSCLFYSGEEYSSYYCNYWESCCPQGCCRRAFGFWNLWYFWFMVMMILMLCSGGSYWYRRRRYVITQDAAGNTYVHTATGTPIAVYPRQGPYRSAGLHTVLPPGFPTVLTAPGYHSQPVPLSHPTLSPASTTTDTPPKYSDIYKDDAPPPYTFQGSASPPGTADAGPSSAGRVNNIAAAAPATATVTSTN